MPKLKNHTMNAYSDMEIKIYVSQISALNRGEMSASSFCRFDPGKNNSMFKILVRLLQTVLRDQYKGAQ